MINFFQDVEPEPKRAKEEKPFKCENCDFSSERKQNLKRHFITHSSIEHMACHKCNKKIQKEHLVDKT